MNRPAVLRMHPLKAVAACGLAVLLAACGEPAGTPARITADTILVDGSSTVYPLTREAARRFRRGARGAAAVDVRFSGTTAGFRRFCTGETDIANASRPMNREEEAECARNGVEHLRLPIATDAVSIVVHPDNGWAHDISIEELGRLWAPEAEGRIVRWQDLRKDWPDRPIVLFGRGQDSGTYDHFTESVTGAARRSRHDYTASEDEERLAEGIAGEPDALGFFGIGAYHRHWDSLKLLAVDNGQGPVFPTLDTVKAGRYQPLSRPLYLYVNRDAFARKPQLRPFLRSYLGGLRSWIHFTGFMPLDPAAYADGLRRLAEDGTQAM
ncbi:PstS family phosphate ABC transporter substrate-binding protein [Luteimonas sp. R10]|uniref:PstS family phosphate ABC transporter substrate-binding protein n=1 Tax=Luteimonas sp. R10 TaxID=3108176 RepID=UPI003089285E|nr:PstS family phosphate ABC transporter substrate-binding protein [Luteimonas sp. R10]